MHKAWIIGAVAVVAALWYATREPAGAPTPAANKTTHAPAAQQRSGELELEVASLRAQVGALRHAVADTAAHAPEGERERAPEPPDPAKIQEQERTMIDELSDRLDAALAAEPVDERWRVDYEHEVAAYLASQELTGYAVDELECRSNMCRMRVSYPDPSVRERFLGTIGTGPFTGGSFFRQSEDGAGSIVYLARPGRAKQFRQVLADANAAWN